VCAQTRQAPVAWKAPDFTPTAPPSSTSFSLRDGSGYWCADRRTAVSRPRAWFQVDRHTSLGSTHRRATRTSPDRVGGEAFFQRVPRCGSHSTHATSPGASRPSSVASMGSSVESTLSSRSESLDYKVSSTTTLERAPCALPLPRDRPLYHENGRTTSFNAAPARGSLYMMGANDLNYGTRQTIPRERLHGPMSSPTTSLTASTPACFPGASSTLLDVAWQQTGYRRAVAQNTEPHQLSRSPPPPPPRHTCTEYSPLLRTIKWNGDCCCGPGRVAPDRDRSGAPPYIQQEPPARHAAARSAQSTHVCKRVCGPEDQARPDTGVNTCSCACVAQKPLMHLLTRVSSSPARVARAGAGRVPVDHTPSASALPRLCVNSFASALTHGSASPLYHNRFAIIYHQKSGDGPDGKAKNKGTRLCYCVMPAK
jgi:hypothetical protein